MGRTKKQNVSGSSWTVKELRRYRITRRDYKRGDLIRQYPGPNDSRFLGIWDDEPLDSNLVQQILWAFQLSDDKFINASTANVVRKAVDDGRQPNTQHYFQELKCLQMDIKRNVIDDEVRIERLVHDVGKLDLNVIYDADYANGGRPLQLEVRSGHESIDVGNLFGCCNDGSITLNLPASHPKYQVLQAHCEGYYGPLANPGSKVPNKHKVEFHRMPLVQLEAKRGGDVKGVVPQCAAELVVAVERRVDYFHRIYLRNGVDFCSSGHVQCKSKVCVARSLQPACRAAHCVYMNLNSLSFVEMECTPEYLEWLYAGAKNSTDSDDDDDDSDDDEDNMIFKVYGDFDMCIEEDRQQVALVLAGLLQGLETKWTKVLDELTEQLKLVDPDFRQRVTSACLKRTRTNSGLSDNGSHPSSPTLPAKRKIKTAHAPSKSLPAPSDSPAPALPPASDSENQAPQASPFVQAPQSAPGPGDPSHCLSPGTSEFIDDILNTDIDPDTFAALYGFSNLPAGFACSGSFRSEQGV